MKAAHAFAAALALSSGLALAQSSQNSDQNTSTNGAPDPQRIEQQSNTAMPSSQGSRNLGDTSTMNNNGDYLDACKELGQAARKDCMAQAKRDRMNNSSSSSTRSNDEATSRNAPRDLIMNDPAPSTGR